MVKTCMICEASIGEQDEHLDIWGQAICRACEQRIVSAAVCDEDYEQLINKLRRLWHREDSKG